MAATEYEIYLPLNNNEGKPVPPAVLESIKETLTRAFGGYTEVAQGAPGEWSMGGVSFHDRISLVRVLDDGSSSFDMWGYKRRLATLLEQEEVLIVARQVRIL